MCMYVHCSVNSSKTFMLKVCLLSVPWCCDIVTVVCCIKTRLEICSTCFSVIVVCFFSLH